MFYFPWKDSFFFLKINPFNSELYQECKTCYYNRREKWKNKTNNSYTLILIDV